MHAQRTRGTARSIFGLGVWTVLWIFGLVYFIFHAVLRVPVRALSGLAIALLVLMITAVRLALWVGRKTSHEKRRRAVLLRLFVGYFLLIGWLCVFYAARLEGDISPRCCLVLLLQSFAGCSVIFCEQESLGRSGITNVYPMRPPPRRGRLRECDCRASQFVYPSRFSGLP
jgi:hypothetical protein